MAHVVQVDLEQSGGRAELVEPAGDRVRVRRLAVFSAEQQPVILII
jgi:hypothetical protein